MMYKFIAYIPDGHQESVKQALFEAGAGKLGNYDACSWQLLGIGQFRPLKGSNPALGHIGQIEQVPEWRVEMVVDGKDIKTVIDAYKLAHPYEMPACDVYALIIDD